MRIFKASALWVDAFYKSKYPYVCPSVFLSVCLLLRYRLNVFLPPLLVVGCPKILEILNPWGKVADRNGLRFEYFFWKWSKIAKKRRRKKKTYCALKTWQKSHFPLDQRPLVKGISLILSYFQTFLSFCNLDDFFRFSKKLNFGVFLVQQNMVETTLPYGLETSGQRVYRLLWHSSRHFEFLHFG